MNTTPFFRIGRQSRKSISSTDLLVALLLVVALGAGCATRTDTALLDLEKATGIHIGFAPGAKLSSEEISQVISLVAECGMKEVAKIETLYMLPTNLRSIVVTGKEHKDGRNIAYERIHVERDGWTSDKPGPDAKRQGIVWTRTTPQLLRLREFQFRGQSLRIFIDHGIDTGMADIAIPAICELRVKFERSGHRMYLERIMQYSKPVSIELSDSNFPGPYKLRVGDIGGHVIYFDFKDGEVVIKRIGYWNV